MKVCKAPTLRLKTLNRHNTENVIRSLTANAQCANQHRSKDNYVQDVQDMRAARANTHTHIHTHTHTHTHTKHNTVQTDRDEGQRCSTEIFGEDKYPDENERKVKYLHENVHGKGN